MSPAEIMAVKRVLLMKVVGRLMPFKQYISEHGDDLPEIAGWSWGQRGAAARRGTSTEGDNV